MIYDPEALTENDRRWQYSMIWVGAAGAVFGAALGTYLMVLFFVATGDVANEFGFWLASGETRDDVSIVSRLTTSGLTAMIVLSLAFYAGYAFAWVRDKVGEAE